MELSGEASSAIADALKHAGGGEERLSPMQREALLWAARGKTVSETAQILGLTQHTIRTHCQIARGKLRAVNIVQAVVSALALGVIGLEDIYTTSKRR